MSGTAKEIEICIRDIEYDITIVLETLDPGFTSEYCKTKEQLAWFIPRHQEAILLRLQRRANRLKELIKESNQ
jgi:hypothetical protein